jgi:hypothetical protein
MQAVRLFAMVAVIMFMLPIASVFGAGYQISDPILGTSGNGAPALGAPSLFSGVFTAIYADGAPVVLSSNKVNFYICSTNCIWVPANLKQTAPGTYSYTFTPPSLSGTVTIFVYKGSLADDNGRIFPSVTTQIGTYASPTSTSLSTPPSIASGGQPLPASSIYPESSQLTRQAVATSPVPQRPPIVEVALTLILLSLVGVGLLVVPTRRK